MATNATLPKGWSTLPPGWSASPGGQGSQPTTPSGTTVVDPSLGEMLSTTGKAVGKFGIDALAGLGQSALESSRHIGSLIFPNRLATRLGLAPGSDEAFQPQNPVQGAFKGVGNVAQFAIPGEAEKVGAAKLATLAPRLGRFALPAAKAVISGLSTGLVNKAEGGEFWPGALLGAGGSTITQRAQAAAPSLAEAALKVRGNQKLFGRTVGNAILEDTRGLTPTKVGRTAQETIGQLTPELTAADLASGAAGNRVSLAPAREAIQNRIAGYEGNRALGTAADIQPVLDFLQRDQLPASKLGGEGTVTRPLAEMQTPAGARALKRGLTADYIGRWAQDQQPATQKAAAREAYGLLNRELHGTVPETAALDQRISSLIPVVQQGERVAVQQALPGRVAERIARPTGGLAPAIAGAYSGGLPGAVAGLVLPEALSSPIVRLIIARGLYRAPTVAPFVAGTGLQLLDRNRGNQ